MIDNIKRRRNRRRKTATRTDVANSARCDPIQEAAAFLAVLTETGAIGDRNIPFELRLRCAVKAAKYYVPVSDENTTGAAQGFGAPPRDLRDPTPTVSPDDDVSTVGDSRAQPEGSAFVEERAVARPRKEVGMKVSTGVTSEGADTDGNHRAQAAPAAENAPAAPRSIKRAARWSFKPTTKLSPYDLVGLDLHSIENESAQPDAAWLPRVKLNKIDGIDRIVPDHPDRKIGWQLLMKALGIRSPDLMADLLQHIALATLWDHQINLRAVNAAIAILVEQKPRNHMEAILIADTFCYHNLLGPCMRDFAHVLSLEHQQKMEAVLTRATKSYVSVANALKNYHALNQRQDLAQAKHAINPHGRERRQATPHRSAEDFVPDQTSAAANGRKAPSAAGRTAPSNGMGRRKNCAAEGGLNGNGSIGHDRAARDLDGNAKSGMNGH